MSEMDVLFPLPDGRRNADDMGMPPEQAMSDDERHRDELLAENERLQTQVQGYREDVTREVEANYVTIQTVYKLRALLRERCPECNGTGMRDSGGTHPWGEPALLPCDHGIDAALKEGT